MHLNPHHQPPRHQHLPHIPPILTHKHTPRTRYSSALTSTTFSGASVPAKVPRKMRPSVVVMRRTWRRRVLSVCSAVGGGGLVVVSGSGSGCGWGVGDVGREREERVEEGKYGSRGEEGEEGCAGMGGGVWEGGGGGG
ncbi:hypothetical protein B0H34DRAFT_804276 [Crassisporium funariophilum]|nr:hypothetical protein B0H34DRAFT_804276 [Crassisporium funariophilum]